jgi:hypothetical protein
MNVTAQVEIDPGARALAQRPVTLGSNIGVGLLSLATLLLQYPQKTFQPLLTVHNIHIHI